MTARIPRVNLGLDRFSGLYLWAVFIVVFAFWTPDLFLSMATVHSIASEQAITGMLGIAVLIPLAGGTYDLSVGATVNISAVLAASLQTSQHRGMGFSIAVALLASVAIGVLNGFFVVKLKINSFIATLGMATIVGAFQQIATGNTQPNPPTGKAWNDIAQYDVGGFQIVIFFLLAIVLIAWWALDHTPAGRYLYAIGGNREAARLAGVPVGRWTWLSLIASSTICGVAGVLYSSQNGPSLTFGAALLLPAFAAAFLGSTQLFPGRFNVWGTIIAVFVLATGVKGLQFVTGVQWLSDMFNGVALLAAVGFAVWRQEARKAAREREPRPVDGSPDRPPSEAPRSTSAEADVAPGVPA
jgi:ribose transport system permease protein